MPKSEVSEREEVIMHLPPGVMKVLSEYSERSGDAISQICENVIMEALRVWD